MTHPERLQEFREEDGKKETTVENGEDRDNDNGEREIMVENGGDDERENDMGKISLSLPHVVFLRSADDTGSLICIKVIVHGRDKGGKQQGPAVYFFLARLPQSIQRSTLSPRYPTAETRDNT
ncbi:hypothetical protein ACLOJK_039324 [Asimina triloba]